MIIDFVTQLTLIVSVVCFLLYLCYTIEILREFMVRMLNDTLKQYFSYIVVFSLIGGGNRSTGRKPPTCRKSLKNLLV